MADPQFSVIIPTFNRERTIERALESVHAQRQPAGEIILVDDGSGDGTAALARRRFPDVRLLQLESNQGPAIARNTAIEHAIHDHLAFLDSDDAWDPDYLAAIGEAWEANPEAAIVYTGYEKIEDRPDGRVDPMDVRVEGDQIEAMLRNNFIHSCSLMSTRRDWTVAVGGFDPAFKIGEDRAMYLRLLLRGPAVAVARRLVRRHVGNDNLINDLERWWQDATAIVASFVAHPDFAGYRWIEEQSRARVFEVIRWHDRALQNASRAARDASVKGDPTTSTPSQPKDPILSDGWAGKRAGAGSRRIEMGASYLFLHTDGLPIKALSTLLTATEAFGCPRPWFDHEGAMLNEAAARGTPDFAGYFQALQAEAAAVGRPWSAIVGFRDLAWLAEKPAFRRWLGEAGLDVIRVRTRDRVLQACRIAAGRCFGDQNDHIDYASIAETIIELEQTEAAADRWQEARRQRTYGLWLEDLHQDDCSALKTLIAQLAPSSTGERYQRLEPATSTEMAFAEAFREEAAHRRWSHALLPRTLLTEAKPAQNDPGGNIRG